MEQSRSQVVKSGGSFLRSAMKSFWWHICLAWVAQTTHDMRPRDIVDIMWSAQRHFAIGRYDHWLVWTDTVGTSSNSFHFLRSAQRGPWVCLIPFAGEEGIGEPACSWCGFWECPPKRHPSRFSLREALLEKAGAMLRMTRFGLGCVEGPPSQDKRLGFAISWPGFPGVSRSMSFWPWNWKYKAGLFLKFPGLFLKFPGLFLNFPGLVLKFPGLNSKVSRNKGLASAPERKRP